METVDQIENPLTYHMDLGAVRQKMNLPAKAPMNVGEHERLASMIGGGMLAAFGLSRRTPLGVGLALLGGMLVHRGTTGRCNLYEKMGVNTR